MNVSLKVIQKHLFSGTELRATAKAGVCVLCVRFIFISFIVMLTKFITAQPSNVWSVHRWKILLLPSGFVLAQ